MTTEHFDQVAIDGIKGGHVGGGQQQDAAAALGAHIGRDRIVVADRHMKAGRPHGFAQRKGGGCIDAGFSQDDAVTVAGAFGGYEAGFHILPDGLRRAVQRIAVASAAG